MHVPRIISLPAARLTERAPLLDAPAFVERGSSLEPTHLFCWDGQDDNIIGMGRYLDVSATIRFELMDELSVDGSFFLL